MASSMTALASRTAAAATAAAAIMAASTATAQQGFHPPPAPVTSAPTREYISDASLTQLFTSLCVKAFPDAAAVEAALKPHSLSQLTPEQAAPYLPDGSGKGGLVRTSDALFAVTVEQEPNQTC